MISFCCCLLLLLFLFSFFFFFNDTATTEIYTLSLHDALPICSFRMRNTSRPASVPAWRVASRCVSVKFAGTVTTALLRSEEHTSELQSLAYLVCRLLLEKKKKNKQSRHSEDINKRHSHRRYVR